MIFYYESSSLSYISLRMILNYLILYHLLNIFVYFKATWTVFINGPENGNCLSMQQNWLICIWGFLFQPGNYNFKNHSISLVHSFKDLGITVDDKLTFREHIKNISVTAHRLCPITYHAFSTRQPLFLARVFTAYTRPKLEYVAPVWSPHLKCDIAIIDRVLNLFTKRIAQLPDLSYTECLSLMKLSSLTQRRQLLDISLFHKILHRKSALKLGEFHNSASQNRSLRTSGKCLHLPVLI